MANEGEILFCEYMRATGADIEDVTANPEYWDKDIDFILIGADGSTTTLEVKWDERIAATGNMFIEHTSNYDTNAKGWFEFCKADYLLYGDAQKRLFYIIDMNELRAQIKRKCYKERRAKDYKRDGSIKYSVGWLVPINDVKHTVL